MTEELEALNSMPNGKISKLGTEIRGRKRSRLKDISSKGNKSEIDIDLGAKRLRQEE
jgi:hypothetical protein